jgi:acetyl esterase
MYVHPELAGILGRLPARPADPYADIKATRADFKAMMAPLMRGDPRVAVEHADAGGVPVQVLRPAGLPGTLPCVIYIHGGGFAYGELDGPSPMAQQVGAEVGAVVVNVDYRLAPEHRFPAGIEDCYTALCWTADHAADLGIDKARIAVSGASAGGNLSAALCLLARDRGGPAIACQCLLIPITDDRLDRYPSISRITDPRVINGAGIAHTWRNYLGPDGSGAAASEYAAPARAASLSGLPPAYILTCGLDPLRDQGLDFARALMAADVPVEVKDVPGAWHFFEAYAPGSQLAQRTTAHWLAALRGGLEPRGASLAA